MLSLKQIVKLELENNLCLCGEVVAFNQGCHIKDVEVYVLNQENISFKKIQVKYIQVYIQVKIGNILTFQNIVYLL